MDQTVNNNQRKIHLRRIWLFRFIAAVVFPLLVLGLLELGLRIIGYGHATKFYRLDKIDDQPVYRDNRNFSLRFFPPALARRTLPFALPVEKPPRSFRIVVLGASAAQGTPKASYGFPHILEKMLKHTYPQLNIELLNAAMTAINSHVVYQATSDIIEMEPDLLIIYLGNNEVVGPYSLGTVFGQSMTTAGWVRTSLNARSTRLGQLLANIIGSTSTTDLPTHWQGMAMFLDQQVRHNDPRLEQVYANFQTNLHDIMQIAINHNIPVLLSTVAVNLKDSPPFASQHRLDLSESDLGHWQSLYQQGITHQQNDAFSNALNSYREALAIDNTYAELHFRVGRCLEKMQIYDAAKLAYQAALQYDTLRFRADRRINETIRTVARKHADSLLKLIDFDQIIRQASENALPGQEHFYEHVHLNFEGNFLLARSMLAAAAKYIAARFADVSPASEEMTPELCRRYLALTGWNQYRLAQTVVNDYLKTPPFTEQLFQEQRLDQWEHEIQNLRKYIEAAELMKAQDEYTWALQQSPQDMQLHYDYGLFCSLARRDPEQAAKHFTKFLQRHPDDDTAHNHLGAALYQSGQHQQARRHLQEALALNPYFSEACVNLALVAQAQGDLSEAEKMLRRAIQLRPDLGNAHLMLAQLLQNNKKNTEAEQVYRDAVALIDNFEPGWYELAELLRRQDRLVEAAEAYHEIIALQPNTLSARNNLGMILLKLDKTDDALKQFYAALKFSPDSAEVHFNLARVLMRLEKYAESIEHFQRAIEQRPQALEARALLAQAAFHAGTVHWPTAIEHYQFIISVRPDTPQALNGLAWILATTPQSAIANADQAVKFADRASELTGYQNPVYLDTLAVTHAAAGNFQEAVQWAQKALTLVREKQTPDLEEQIKSHIDGFEKKKIPQP